jgi:hypothetical protein
MTILVGLDIQMLGSNYKKDERRQQLFVRSRTILY